jgi:F-type H+-transporting ATPase subunit O
VKSSSLDSTAKALSNLSEVYTKDPKLAQILLAPTLSAEDKTSIVNELVKSSGGADKEGTVKNFLTTLADYNRLGLLKGVTEKFAELISAGKGEVELTVTSATVSFVSFCCLLEGKERVEG